MIGIIIFMAVSPMMPGAGMRTGQKEKEKKQDKKQDKKEDNGERLYYEMTVTATRSKKDTFEIPRPVSVVNQQKITEKLPNNITELLTELPGLDVNGVGPNQGRPVIRGFRGQRILLMEDGVRLNNSRRERDFGAITGPVEVSNVEQVEVVRGPSSVLYGSDAIGGVVNIITRTRDYDTKTSALHGNIRYRYGSADGQNKGAVTLSGNSRKLGFRLSGHFRESGNYEAPAGHFGNIRLEEDVVVGDTGIRDGGLDLQLHYAVSPHRRLSFKYRFYRAADGGFGFIEPERYNPGASRVRITYPDQEVDQYTVSYEDTRLGESLNKKSLLLPADRLRFTAYYLRNHRTLDTDIFIPILVPWALDAGININRQNVSDVGTLGFRLELNKGSDNYTLTYGVDFFRDNSRNTDYYLMQTTGLGVPNPPADTTPQVPNALYQSLGVFVQDDISLFKRTSLILGLRYQDVRAETRETPGLEDQPLTSGNDRTVVGSANLLWGVTDHLRLVFSVGRGFRSPNLVERFFQGPTPDGSGYMTQGSGLSAETSFNIDLGFKYRRESFYMESSFFNSVVYDGIRIGSTGETINGLPRFRYINADRLRVRGIEALTWLRFAPGLSATLNFTRIKSSDLGNPEIPHGATYSSKFNLNLRYAPPEGRFFIGYDLRVNGRQKDIILGDNPIGDFVPGFTVHSFSGGITLFKDSGYPQRLGFTLRNFTDQLYSEFSNAAFFRPEPGIHLILSWSLAF